MVELGWNGKQARYQPRAAGIMASVIRDFFGAGNISENQSGRGRGVKGPKQQVVYGQPQRRNQADFLGVGADVWPRSGPENARDLISEFGTGEIPTKRITDAAPLRARKIRRSIPRRSSCSDPIFPRFLCCVVANRAFVPNFHAASPCVPAHRRAPQKTSHARLIISCL